MLRFQHLENLYLLLLLPILVVLFVSLFWWRKNKLQKLGDEVLITKQLLGFIPGRPTLKFVLLLVGLTAAVIGWANLQMASGMEKVQRKGVDVLIAIDVSKSMLAQDIKPDRLTRAKQLVLSMLEKMKNDRVGLIVFAGRAYLQVPLTIDYSALKMMLQNVKPDQIPTPGTMFSEALELSVNSFSKREKKYKSLVIISDGEDHDENAIAKAKEIAETGIIVHTVGVGSPEGTTIFDPTTNALKLDEQGNAVVSKLNENELKSIAASGKGTYSLLRNADVVAEKLVGEIDGMEQKSLGAVVYNSYDSYFQYFLIVAFVLILVEMFLPGANFKKQIVTLLAFFIVSTHCSAQKAEVKTGNTLYEQKKFAEAAKEYQNALQKDPKFAPSAYNLGNALYQQKKFDNARQVFNGASKLSDDKQLNSAANYNIGNSYLEEKKWQEAIDAYKTSLRKNPQDEAAKYNLSYAQAMLKNQQGGGGKNDQKKDQQDKKDQNQNQQNKKDEQKDNQNKDQQNKDQQKPEEKEKQQAQPQDSKLSKEQADQLLNALSQEEKNLHDKKEKGKAVMIKVDKDW